jgi:hypothetical protein
MTFLAAQERLAARTFNRRYDTVRSLARWCRQQGWLDADPLVGLERRSQPRAGRGPWTLNRSRRSFAASAMSAIARLSG